MLFRSRIRTVTVAVPWARQDSRLTKSGKLKLHASIRINLTFPLDNIFRSTPCQCESVYVCQDKCFPLHLALSSYVFWAGWNLENVNFASYALTLIPIAYAISVRFIVTTVEKRYKERHQRKMQKEGFFSRIVSNKPRSFQ